MVGRAIRRAKAGALPDFVPPQLTALTEIAPEGDEWAHELKWDGYRMHARIDAKDVRLLTRTGLDWTDKYPPIVEALRALPVSQAYLDGELCALSEAGLTSFSAMQAPSSRYGQRARTPKRFSAKRATRVAPETPSIVSDTSLV